MGAELVWGRIDLIPSFDIGQCLNLSIRYQSSTAPSVIYFYLVVMLGQRIDLIKRLLPVLYFKQFNDEKKLQNKRNYEICVGVNNNI